MNSQEKLEKTLQAQSAKRLPPLLIMVIGVLLVIPMACQGVEGEDGHAGPVGPPGPPGATGAVGNSGVDGAIGGPGPDGPEGPSGVAGPQGPAGPAGPGAELSDVHVMVDLAVVNLGNANFDEDKIALGGRLYDNWMVTSGIEALPGDHPLWSTQTTNLRTESTTFRCKECHGWDYKGASGVYGSGSHYTGFPGVMRAGKMLTKDDLAQVLRGGFNSNHDFRFDISRSNLDALATFLELGLKNYSELIDYETKLPRQIPVLANGAQRYDRTCGSCHGSEGTDINFGTEEAPVYLADIATENPWEFLHKALYGQPGVSGMPPVSTRGWDDQDLTDLLAYVQSLSD